MTVTAAVTVAVTVAATRMHAFNAWLMAVPVHTRTHSSDWPSWGHTPVLKTWLDKYKQKRAF